MFKTIDLSTTKIDWDQLLQEVREGAEIHLVEGETTIVRLLPGETNQTYRKADLHPDAIWTSDDFDDPLTDEFRLGEE